MHNKISLLFYVKSSKADKNGLQPIYLRITISGKRFEISTSKFIDKSKWNAAATKMKGNTDESRSINGYLDAMRNKAYESEQNLIRKQLEINIDNFKNKFLGIEEKQRMLLSIFQEHNTRMKDLIPQEFSVNTFKRYETSLSHVKEFLKLNYKVSDISIKNVNLAFVNDFDYFLRSVKKCNNNSTIKYVRNLGKIIKWCYANEWIERDPYVNYKGKVKSVERHFLSQEEIDDIYKKKISTPRLEQVKDIFIFSCYTGLAYVDVYNLRKSNIEIGIDGNKWIITNRQKTKAPSHIPLLQIPLELINKYQDHPQCINEERLLPVVSNQKTNSYLKEIADLCGITKELTFHIARHTFATTVTLSNGIPMESVSKMLGHKDLRTTQHYAKIIDKKVGEDMNLLKEKLSFQNLKKKEI